MACSSRKKDTCIGECEWDGERCTTKVPFLTWIVSMRAEPRSVKMKKALIIVGIFTLAFVIFRAAWVHTILRFREKLSVPSK